MLRGACRSNPAARRARPVSFFSNDVKCWAHTIMSSWAVSMGIGSEGA